MEPDLSTPSGAVNMAVVRRAAVLLAGQIGGFLLPVFAGVMAERMGIASALAALALAHLAVVVFAPRRPATSSTPDHSTSSLEAA